MALYVTRLWIMEWLGESVYIWDLISATHFSRMMLFVVFMLYFCSCKTVQFYTDTYFPVEQVTTQINTLLCIQTSLLYSFLSIIQSEPAKGLQAASANNPVLTKWRPPLPKTTGCHLSSRTTWGGFFRGLSPPNVPQVVCQWHWQAAGQAWALNQTSLQEQSPRGPGHGRTRCRSGAGKPRPEPTPPRAGCGGERGSGSHTSGACACACAASG